MHVSVKFVEQNYKVKRMGLFNLFKKEKSTEEVQTELKDFLKEDRFLISDNAAYMGKLTLFADEKMQRKLRDIKEELQFLSPVRNNNAFEIDKRIHDIIEETDVACNNSDQEQEIKEILESAMKELKSQIMMRKRFDGSDLI